MVFQISIKKELVSLGECHEMSGHTDLLKYKNNMNAVDKAWLTHYKYTAQLYVVGTCFYTELYLHSKLGQHLTEKTKRTV